MHPVIGWWSAAALAQSSAEPSLARRCADAATGAEIEICLSLAAQHPDAVDEIAAALVAHVDRREAPDRELLDALRLLLDPVRTLDGITSLGEMSDPRAVTALVQVAQVHIDPLVAAAAVQALGVHGATPILRAWLGDRTRPQSLRIAAAEALGTVASEEAAHALEDLLERPRQPPALRTAASTALAQSWPDRDPPSVVASLDSALWLGAGTSIGLGYAMGAAGQLGRTNLAAVAGATGATGGATAGYLYARAWPQAPGDSALLTTLTLTGIGSGLLVGAGTSQTERGTLVGGLVGEGVGGLAAVLARPAWSGEPSDSVEAAVISALASTAAHGVVATVRPGSDPRGERSLAAGIALGLGSVGGHVAARRITPRASDWAFVGSTALFGAGVGAMIPIAPARRVTTIQAGASVGALVGLAAFEPLSREPRVLAGAWTGAACGGTLGLGIAWMVEPESAGIVGGSMLFGSTLGVVAGGVAAQRDPHPPNSRDGVLTAATTAWTAWTMFGVADLLQPDGIDTRGAGAVLALSATAAAGAGLTANLVDVPVTHTLAASSLGLWGGYAGGVFGQVAGVDPVLPALVGSSTGLVGGIVVVSPWVALPPLVVGIADAGGVLGTSVGAVVASQFDDDPTLIVGASFAGATLGLTGGALLGNHWHRNGTTRDLALGSPRMSLPGRWSLAPLPVAAARGLGGGVQVSVDRW